MHGPRHSRCPGSDKPPLQSDGNHDMSVSSCSQTDKKAAPTYSTQPGSVQPDQRRMLLNNLDHHTLLLASQPSNTFPDLLMPHVHSIWRALFVALSATQPTQPMEPYLNFGHDILRAHKMWGRKRNLASIIIKRTNARRDDDEADVHPSFTHPLRDPTFSKLAAVSAKFENGNITAAVRILCSDEVVSDFSTETLAKHQLKHPAVH